MKIDMLIEQVKSDIVFKKQNNQNQQIDDEFLAYVSVFKHGNAIASAMAGNWMKYFFVNAGYVRSLRDIK
ncbi:hypothetical protein [Enterococcus sp. HY326]|uniref:hypothetical protein n=1 Tax=Enterococcus sp. HY326 TaxID=2971265 RepID=UPI00223F9F34|nr:hypothetical protein [Enterococcus sp. HY326]